MCNFSMYSCNMCITYVCKYAYAYMYAYKCMSYLSVYVCMYVPKKYGYPVIQICDTS